MNPGIKSSIMLRLGGQSLSLMVRFCSTWSTIQAAPADPILGLVAAFKLNPSEQKVNLAQGQLPEHPGSSTHCDLQGHTVTRAETPW